MPHELVTSPVFPEQNTEYHYRITHTGAKYAVYGVSGSTSDDETETDTDGGAPAVENSAISALASLRATKRQRRQDDVASKE